MAAQARFAHGCEGGNSAFPGTLFSGFCLRGAGIGWRRNTKILTGGDEPGPPGAGIAVNQRGLLRRVRGHDDRKQQQDRANADVCDEHGHLPGQRAALSGGFFAARSLAKRTPDLPYHVSD